MTGERAHDVDPPASSRVRSLYGKLVVLSAALVIVPGGFFALLAFDNSRRSLEEAIGIQLAQASQEGSDALSSMLDRIEDGVLSWSRQEVMRELLVDDVDKRVARFLVSSTEAHESYREILCTDVAGRVIAASRHTRSQRNIGHWQSFVAIGGSPDDATATIVGPRDTRDGSAVLEVATRVMNPDPPYEAIGVVVLLVDWQVALRSLEQIRDKFARLDKRVAIFVADARGRIIGHPAPGAMEIGAMGSERWSFADDFRYGRFRPDGAARGREFLVGRAALSNRDWSVVVLEPLSTALAPIDEMRRRWLIMLSSILMVSLLAAVVLARRMARPLGELRDATRRLASDPAATPAAVPVRSGDEIGQLAVAFNSMAADLRRTQAQLLTATKFAFAGELAAGVAHEVRTPLSVMRSSAQMLRDTPSAEADNSELVGMLIEEVDRIERVVSGLLELAKPHSRTVEATGLEAILERAAEFAQARAERQGTVLRREIEAPLPPVLCDREQIYQVALNLIVNALQALGSGGEVVIRARDGGGRGICFEVSDDGPGVPEEMRDRVFQPFVTAREGGTGLGLSIVKRMIEEHGGEIELETAIGKGTTFCIHLPRAQGDAR